MTVEYQTSLNNNVYRALFEQTNDAVFIIGLDLKYINVNYQASKMLGYTYEELIGRDINEITSLEEVPDTENNPSASGLDTINTVYERVLIRKDGSKVPVEVSSTIVYNLDGSPSHIQSTARDISNRKEYEKRIRASEERNKAIVDALPDLIFRVGEDGEIKDFSASPNHPLHMQRSHACNSRLDEIWPETFVTQIQSQIDSVLETKAMQVAKVSYPGLEETFEVRLKPISDHEILGIIRDISEWVQLEQMKSDFINRASHELRTPLTTSILMAELIDEGGTDEEKAEFWATLKHELNRQKILVDRLLMAGRLESNTLAVSMNPVDIQEIISDSVASVKPIAKKGSIDIVTTFQENLPKVLGDVSAMQQVFINLINNAIKFSPPGGAIFCDVKTQNKGVLVRIIDQGLGIPASEISMLFDRFFRARNVRAAEIPGSGIGLFIVKSIIEELEGKIWVESELNIGTTFFMWFKT